MAELDYDPLASTYDRRYAVHEFAGTRECIFGWLASSSGPRVLEVGCGTGKWLEALAAQGCEVAGADPSAQMLARAQARVRGDLKHAPAEALPWPDESFDALMFVNAFHHVRDPRQALREAHRVLRSGGRFLSIGLDPHAHVGRWFVYEYFPSTLELDRGRFASRDKRTGWLLGAGFDEIQVSIAEHIADKRSYEQAQQQGILEPTYTSQLSLLSPSEYHAGLARLRDAVRQQPGLELEANLYLFATTAQKP
jgi:ubiquinone/menaquinone biosynthesis C-methylase UbiE